MFPMPLFGQLKTMPDCGSLYALKYDEKNPRR